MRLVLFACFLACVWAQSLTSPFTLPFEPKTWAANRAKAESQYQVDRQEMDRSFQRDTSLPNVSPFLQLIEKLTQAKKQMNVVQQQLITATTPRCQS